MQTSKTFKEVIKNHLDGLAAKDPLFAETLKKTNKSIGECCNYILSCVQKSGNQGFADEEIFAMAVHYYDEDDIKDIKPLNAKVVVNHSVGASTAAAPATSTQVAKVPKKPSKPVIVNQPSLF